MMDYILGFVVISILVIILISAMYGASEAHNRCSNCENCLMFDRKGRVYCSCLGGYSIEPPPECKLFVKDDKNEEVTP